MQTKHNFYEKTERGIRPAALAALLLAACGGGGVGSGPAIEARAQAISFGVEPTLSLPGTATVTASASSGLAVSFSSTTPGICTIGGSTVTALTAGTCTIAANQGGNSTFAQAPQVIQNIAISKAGQTISFGAAPSLSFPGTATVSATTGSGLSVTFSSTTPGVCTISGSTVTGLAAGICTIAADQAGNADYNAATQVTQNIAVGKANQNISFVVAPALGFFGTATVVATANSGLAVSYSSATPLVCSVNSATGLVTDLTAGTCTVAADQAGDANYNAATRVTQDITVGKVSQTISFGAPPALSVPGTATVSATASSGLAVSFSSTTQSICTISGSTVTAVAPGTCTIAANQAGDGSHNPAPQVTQNITASVSATAPGTPTGVTATAGIAFNQVVVSVGATSNGGSPITGYTATFFTGGVSAGTAFSAALPITATCPAAASCAGYAIAVHATNAIGNGPASAPVDVLTNYNVTETFYEPDTQPRDSIFVGTFTFNSTTRTVTNLRGVLSESMTGNLIAYNPATGPRGTDDMTWLALNNQLSSVPATLGGVSGLLVTTFLNNNTNTLTTMPMFGGTDGWSPGTGNGLYYGNGGMPMGSNAGNAYARIFVNTDDPRAPPTQAQIYKLAYADCAPGGMMMMTCMTGTTVAGYGYVGTMSGYPVSQVITKQ